MGLGATITSMRELGIIGKGTEKQLMRVNAVVGLVSGIFQTWKGIIAVVAALRGALIGLAGIETYRAALKSPAAIGFMVAGLAAAGAVAGYFYGKSQSSSAHTHVEQNIQFSAYNQPDQRAMARGSFEVMGGI